MSGGFDSSVVAWILHQAGFKVLGFSIKHLENERMDSSSCCNVNDLMRAKILCSQLKIPHYTLNLTEEFSKEVLESFLLDSFNGRTPIPCSSCNRIIRFDLLLERVKKFKADFLATGHYIKKIGNKLYEAEDKSRDQSYFLSSIRKESLPSLLFPLGSYRKSEIEQNGNFQTISKLMKSFQKKESRGLCFIEKDMKSFFQRQEDTFKEHIKKGRLLDDNYNLLSYHNGLHHFTIGQTKGLGLGDYGTKFFVLRKEKNDIILTRDEKKLSIIAFYSKLINSFFSLNFLQKKKIWVRIRREGEKIASKLIEIKKGNEKTVLKIEALEEGRFHALTPGQLAVAYVEDSKGYYLAFSSEILGEKEYSG